MILEEGGNTNCMKNNMNFEYKNCIVFFMARRAF
jgi:hypothetical protein